MNFRCEFCEIILKSDLDVSKHLDSQKHHESVQKAHRLHPIERDCTKDVPKNIGIVYERLQLRSSRDVRNLEDKGYFRIPSDAPNVVRAVDRMSDILRKKLADHLCRNLSSRTKALLLESLDDPWIKKERQAAKTSGQPSMSENLGRSPLTSQPGRLNDVTDSTNTTQTPVPTQVNKPVSKSSASQTSTSSQPRNPVRSTNTANPNISQSQILIRPKIPGSSLTPSQTTIQARQIRESPTQNVRLTTHRLPITPNITPQRSDLVQQTRPAVRQQSNHPRLPAQQMRPRMQTDNVTPRHNQPGITADRIASRPSHIEQPQTAIRSHPPTIMTEQLPHPEILAGPPGSIGPSFCQPDRLQQPANTMSEPAQSTLPPIFSMPRPSVNQPTPQPRSDSTYRPKLSIVKIEPKDRD